MEPTSKRKLVDFQSPEKRAAAEGISQALIKLNKGLLDENETGGLVNEIKEFMGEHLHCEFIEKVDDINARLDQVATNIQIQQLEGQL